MYIQPYVFFDGRCDEAIAFYAQALGAQVLMRMTFGEGPPGDSQCADGAAPPADKVMHACLRIGQSTVFLSDGFSKGQPEFKGFNLSLSVADDAEAKRVFNALAQGGRVEQPLIQTFFASSFGMVVDRFGVSWMVLVPTQSPA